MLQFFGCKEINIVTTNKSWYKNMKKTGDYRYKTTYCLPKISNKTDKGKWLNSFANAFIKNKADNIKSSYKKHDVNKQTFTFNLKGCVYNIDGCFSALVALFKNFKKLGAHHFEGEVFKYQLTNMKEAA